MAAMGALADPSTEPVAGELVTTIRRAPEPLHGGLLTLARFLRDNGMLTPRYCRLLLRLIRLKLRYGGRLKTRFLPMAQF